MTHFTDGDNIGLRSLAGLIFVDDDFPTTAVACMDDWLPQTGAIYGRPQRPRAKRLYICKDLTETVTFTDTDGAHLLQIRVGLNTGEVVLRAIRKDDLHTEYTPIGHSTSLAARMENLASQV